MKKAVLLAGLMFSGPVLAGPFAPAAGEPGSTALHMDDASIIAWATGWQDYQTGTNVDAGFQTPDKALGEAVGNSYDIVSLGRGGSITLTFDAPIVNGDGDDFAVFENSISDTFLELAWVEVSSNGSDFFRFENYSFTASSVGAFGSVDPTNLYGLAGKYRQGYGTPFDLNEFSGTAGLDLDSILYVRLVDIVGDGTAYDDYPYGGPNTIYDPYPTIGSAGFDLDAIGVLNQGELTVTPVPLPVPVWLLGSALVLLNAWRRKA